MLLYVYAPIRARWYILSLPSETELGVSSLVHVADVPGRRALRSAGLNRLQIPPFKLSITVGGRAFPVAAARFWNRFPDNVTSANSLSAFWRQLKHTLFKQSFPDIIV